MNPWIHAWCPNADTINDFPSEFADTWSDEAKTTFYLAERLSPETALYYQFGSILPFTNVGYAYSDNWTQGAKWDGIMLGTLIFAEMIKGDCSRKHPYDEDRYCENGYEVWENQSEYNILQLATLGIYIYKFVNAYNLAEEYNDNLYQGLFMKNRPYFSLEVSTNKNALFALNVPIGK